MKFMHMPQMHHTNNNVINLSTLSFSSQVMTADLNDFVPLLSWTSLGRKLKALAAKKLGE